MKKHLLILFISLLLSYVSDAGIMMRTRGVPCDGDLICEGFEGSGYEYGSWTEDTTGSATLDPDFTGTVLLGSQSLEADDSANDGRAHLIGGDFTATNPIYGFFTFVATTFNATDTDFIKVRDISDGEGAEIYLESAQLRCFAIGGTPSDDSVTLTHPNKYYVWWDFTKGSGNATINLYTSTTPTKPGAATCTSSNGTRNTDMTEFTLRADDGNVVVFDEVLVASSAIGSRTPVCSKTNITFWWRAEALNFSATNGTLDYSVDDDIGEIISIAAINSDAAKYGTNGLDIPSSSDSIVFNDGVITDVIDDAEGRVGFWWRYTTWGDLEAMFRLYDDSSNVFYVRMNSSDEIEFTWTDGGTSRTTLASTTSPLSSSGTWYFIEAAWKTADDYRELFVNGASVGSSSATIGQFSGDPIDWRFGASVGGISVDYHMDQMFISSDSTHDLYACRNEAEYPE